MEKADIIVRPDKRCRAATMMAQERMREMTPLMDARMQ